MRHIWNKFPSIFVRGRGPVERKPRVPLQVKQIGFDSVPRHTLKNDLKIFVKRGGRTNNNPTRNTGKGEPTTLPILFNVVMVKKLGSSRNNEKKSSHRTLKAQVVAQALGCN